MGKESFCPQNLTRHAIPALTKLPSNTSAFGGGDPTVIRRISRRSPITMATHSSPTTSSSGEKTAKIPIEIISEEEMALIEAAFAASAMPVSQLHRSPRSIRSISLLSKRGLSACTTTGPPDIEDSDRVVGSNSPSPRKNKRDRLLEPFLHRFRKGRGLSVTDLTGTEWCEKQTEFILLFGKPKKTKAMRAGSARHVVLEEEVIKRVKVQVESAEDVWAVKFMNFIAGANQLLFDGLTRELPLVGFIEGVWMVGIIDEIRMPASSESTKFPVLVDTKTRVRPTLPSEPQKRNGRFQLMCYKYMWDALVADKFPSQKFFDFFSLNPNHILSPEIRDSAAKSGFLSEVNGFSPIMAFNMIFCIEKWRFPFGTVTHLPIVSIICSAAFQYLIKFLDFSSKKYADYSEKQLERDIPWNSLSFCKKMTQKLFLIRPRILRVGLYGDCFNYVFMWLLMQTLSDVVRYFGNSCCLLPQAHDQLLLRYELQEDQSLLGEDEFSYDPDLVKDQIKSCLEFWLGKREASYPPMEELWKCKFCKFASVCPVKADPNDSPSKMKSEDIPSPDLPRS